MGFFGNRPQGQKPAPAMMKTDIKETEKAFELDIDLPGFKKETFTPSCKTATLP